MASLFTQKWRCQEQRSAATLGVMEDDRIIRVMRPKREWLLHCDGDEEGVLSLHVSNGVVEILAPAFDDMLRLERSQIAEFRQALDEAIDLAEADLRAQRV